jgi:hypothetical protein
MRPSNHHPPIHLAGKPLIVDIRTYNIVPRKMPAYLALFEEYALPVQRRHLGDPLAYFVTEHGELHQVVHVWGYESLADMEVRRAARDADPAWLDYQQRTEGLVVSQSNKLARPTAWSGIR